MLAEFSEQADLSKPETIPATLVGVHTVIDCATGRPEEPIKTVRMFANYMVFFCVINVRNRMHVCWIIRLLTTISINLFFFSFKSAVFSYPFTFR